MSYFSIASDISFFHILVLSTFLSCGNLTSTPQKDALTKLTADQMVDRTRNGIFADQTKVTYIMESGDTITYDSLLKLSEQSPIALDDYVNSEGVVVKSVVREFSEEDKLLQSRMQAAYTENQHGDIKGNIKIEVIESKFLKESRFLNVYLPPNKNDNTPVFYLMDGGYQDDVLNKIDELISEEKIHPFIMVGVESSMENRHKEYVFNNKDSTQFTYHMNFFKNEVINYVENEILEFPRQQENRYIYGNSNGGDFSVFCALKNPTLFNEAISFSGTASIKRASLLDLGNMDKTTSFYLAAGIHEPEFLETNKKITTLLRSNGFGVEFFEFDAGHDWKMWKEQFLIYILDRFKIEA